MGRRSVNARDLLQLPTAITATSFGMVIDGSRKIDTLEGKTEVVLGRLGDVVDGYVARRLDMSSDAGAIADATCDKIGMLAIGAALWKHDTAPKPVLAAMAVRNVINAGATLYHGLSDPEHQAIRPPTSGKYAMAADNISLGAFMVADELQKGSRGYKIARTVGYVAAVAGLLFGYDSTKRYLKGDFDDVQS